MNDRDPLIHRELLKQRMSFDPHHKWLGIPPDQQPANHYRLLGIDLFESDTDVIEAAASQRAAYLHDVATGEHVAESQKLLSEVAVARRCLLDSDAKAAYDDELEESLDLGPPARNLPVSWLIAGGGILATGLAVLVIALMSGGGGDGRADPDRPADAGMATLILDWPLNEREAAELEIDGERREIPAEKEVKFTLSPGQHHLYLRRRGYVIDSPVRLQPGRVERLRLNWRAED